MKKLAILLFISSAVLVISCSDIKRKPGSTYMPDMAYSRAYETYADHSNLAQQDIHYNSMPVTGTVARGEELPFPYSRDAAGDTTNYVASKQVQNPLPPLNTKEMQEAQRLYLINCGICHGAALDGNGPLYKDGTGPYPAAPKNLVTLDMPDGQMFYSITYGKNLMGPYGSQLSRKQRWMIIHYINSKQTASTTTAGASDSSAENAK